MPRQIFRTIIQSFQKASSLSKPNMLKFRIILTVAILLFGQAETFGQESRVIRVESDRTRHCEFSSAILGSLSFQPDDEVLVLSIRGKRDTVFGIEKKRLGEAEKYLISYGDDSFGGKWKSNITGAIATKKAKEGRLDFYVNGVLRLSMSYFKNREARFTSCA